MDRGMNRTISIIGLSSNVKKVLLETGMNRLESANSMKSRQVKTMCLCFEQARIERTTTAPVTQIPSWRYGSSRGVKISVRSIYAISAVKPVRTNPPNNERTALDSPSHFSTSFHETKGG